MGDWGEAAEGDGVGRGGRGSKIKYTHKNAHACVVAGVRLQKKCVDGVAMEIRLWLQD